MADIDGLKEELSILKNWLNILAVTLLGLIGWVATSYEKASLLIIIGAIISIICLIIAIFVLNKKIKAKIKEIKKA